MVNAKLAHRSRTSTASRLGVVARIRECADDMAALSDVQLRTQASTFLKRKSVETKRSWMRASWFPWRPWGKPEFPENWIEGLSLITEAVRRTTGKLFYDVQLLGGIELSLGRIAQMQTGEGKTLTTALPTFLHAALRGSVHVATTNAYLAQRDCQELRPALELLGLRVGLLPEEHNDAEAREAYQCDVTFGTGYGFGFDFLRDQIALRSRRSIPLGREHLETLAGRIRQKYVPLQRSHAFAIVDEADSVLIDEATMPLILSASASSAASPEVFQLAKDVAGRLQQGEDFEVDPTKRTVEVTEQGWQKAYAALLNQSELPLQRHWSVYVQNALRAKTVYQRDVDYVVVENCVQIVDQHTGRIHPERTWRDGLHQAVEIQENLPVTAEASSNAKITRQRYFQLYDGMAGMTGTAEGVEGELRDFYELETSIIPTHKPSQRQHFPLRSFGDSETRDAAITDAVIELVRLGRPILVGTRTIRHSRELSARLTAKGVSHRVLNGLQDEEEARVIANAGKCRAVTIATNMAGRGTDIHLDGEGLDRGGLHVIGAEPNLSRRVDRQLAGRAARQGNPGSCQFFVAATDEVVGYDDELRSSMLEGCDASGECRRNLTDRVLRIQQQRDVLGYDTRKAMVARDHWMDDVLKTLAGRKRSQCDT
ncbi:MAG: translocase [Planctomycetaceae bacterium]